MRKLFLIITLLLIGTAGHACTWTDGISDCIFTSRTIMSKPEVTAVSGDYIILRDASDGRLKKANVSSITGSGGTPGGSNPQLQYNNAGAFGGVTGSGTDANGNVGLGTSTPSQQLELTDDFEMVSTTTTAGTVYKGSSRFLHNYADGGDPIDGNIFLGIDAGNFTLSGIEAIGIGSFALNDLTTGSGNVALGFQALESVTTGSINLGIGSYSLASQDTGGTNIAIGNQAMELSDGNDNNACVGSSCLRSLVTGTRNTCVGNSCLFATTADDNTALGYRAGVGGVSSRSVFVGAFAGDGGISPNPDDSVFIGYNSGLNITTGDNNTCIGSGSCDAITTGASNTLLGYDSDVASSGVVSSVGIGKSVLTNDRSVMIGEDVGNAGMNGSDSVFIGYNAGNALATSVKNVCIGSGACEALTDAQDNTAIGYQALASTTSAGINNTAIGYQPLFSNISGTNNIAIGRAALYAMTDSFWNIAIGNNALDSFVGTGSQKYNVAIGGESQKDNLTGVENTSIGVLSFPNLTTGSNNTAVGRNAGDGLFTGSQNVFLGDYAGTSKSDLTNSTAIGYNTQVNQDNTIVLGTSSMGISVPGTTTARNLSITGTLTLGSINGVLTGQTNNNSGIDFNTFTNSWTFSTGTNTWTSSAGDATFFTINNSSSDPFSIRGDGNVGIGNTDPSTDLHVTGGARITGLASCDTIDTDSNGVLACGSDASGGAADVRWDQVLDPGTNAGMVFSAFTNSWTFTTGTNTWTSSAGDAAFFTINNSSDNPFAIRGDGNVGIGYTNPGAALTIDGLVGIGTSAPGVDLDIYNSAGQSSFGNSGGGGLYITNVGETGFIDIKSDGTSADTEIYMGAGTDAFIGFDTTGPERMRITPEGNIGIGVTTAKWKLDNRGTLYSTSYDGTMSKNSGISFGAFTNTWTSTAGDAPWIVFDSSNDMAIRGDGNVGIGETDPSATLYVDGTVTLEDFVSCTALETDGSGVLTCGSDGGGTTESIFLSIYSAKITGAFVVRTPTSGDASTQGAQIDAGDGNWRLLFDATTDEAAVWQFRLPDYWAAHGEVNIFYTMASATAAEVEFEVDVMCITDGDSADIGTDGFVGVAVGSATVPGTAGYPDEISVTVTDDSCAAGDMMFIYLSTDANDATADDATGDREVVGVEYEFTK